MQRTSDIQITALNAYTGPHSGIWNMDTMCLQACVSI